MIHLTFVVIIIVDMIAEGMARRIAPLLLVFVCGSCMEMRETVERMVMVRTTGSDLQPAATGYIYKKESDGPASVQKMGESEVIEHFSKMYEKPEAYKAPIPVAAGPFYAKENDEIKAASYTTEEQIKPVVEKTDEHEDGHIDGLDDEEYDKLFEEYAKQFKDYKKDFADYIHGVGHFDHGVYHDGGGKDYGSKGYHGHGEKGNDGHKQSDYFEKGDAGDYHTQKHEGYSVSKEGGHKQHYDDADEHGKHYAHGHGYKGDDHGYKSGHSKGEAVDGFHKLYDKDEFKKDHDFYDAEGIKGGHHKYANGHHEHGSDAGGHEKGGAHESGHHEGSFGKGGYVDKESGEEQHGEHASEEGGESSQHHHGEFGAKGGKYGGKSYGFEVKH